MPVGQHVSNVFRNLTIGPSLSLNKKRFNNYLKKSTKINGCGGTKYMSLLPLTSIVNQFFKCRLYLAKQYFANSESAVQQSAQESAKPLGLPLAGPT